MVTIEELSFSRLDRKRFLNIEFRLNRDDPLWVPPLRMDRMKYLDPAKNPLFRHAEIAHFVAVRNGRDVGRIAAIRNHRHEELHEELVGFFGFLEAEEDQEVVTALVEAAADRLRGKGLETMRGPLSYDTNEVSGTLVEGFDDPPTVMMPYNRPGLPPLLEGAGLTKARDLLAFRLDSDAMPERIKKLSDRIRSREGITLRSLRKNRFREDVDIVRKIYNRAWEKNWGFIPLTDEEIDYKAADMKQVIDPELVLFSMVDGAEVGFAMTLPDANQALIGVRSGRLFPFGLLKILRAWKRISRVRVVTLGTIPEYRNRGLELLFYRELFERALRHGYEYGECSWVLEDNEAMLKGIDAMGGTLTKRYRIYDRKL